MLLLRRFFARQDNGLADMRHRVWILSAFFLAILPAAAAEPPLPGAGIQGPLLGYLVQGHGTGIRPILGVPGASHLGMPLELPAIESAAVSPNQTFALALESASRAPVVLSLQGAPVTAQPLPGSRSGAARFFFSPTGNTASILYADGWIQTYTGLPANPQLALSAALDSLPTREGLFAPADSGARVLAGIESGGGTDLYLIEDGAPPRWITRFGEGAGLTFLPGQTAAAFADRTSNTVTLISSLAGAPLLSVVATASDGIADPVGLQADGSGGRLLLANRGTGTVLSLRTGGGAAAEPVPCGCAPTMLSRLSGNAVFQLTSGAPGDPLLIYDGDGAQPRVVFVPAPPAIRRDAQGDRRPGIGRSR